MKKIYSYVFKQFATPLLATFIVSLFVLLMQFLWKYVKDIVGKGLDTETLVEFFGYSTLTLVPLALPLAILLASLMTFGNLGERLELLSIKAAGVSLFKVMRPLIVFVSIITLGAFLFANIVLPHSMKELRALMDEIKHQRPELSLKENIFDYSMANMPIKIGSKSEDGSMLYDVMIYNHQDREDPGAVTVADSGTIVFAPDQSYSKITLYSGRTYSIAKEEGKPYPKTLPYRRDRFDKEVIIIPTSTDYERKDADVYGNHRTSQTLVELASSVHKSDSVFKKNQDEITRLVTKSSFLLHKAPAKVDSAYVAQPLNIDSLFLAQSYSKQMGMANRAKEQAAKVKNTIEPKRANIKRRALVKRQYRAERHRRFTLSFACLVFFFIGAPLGAIIRKGGFGMPVVVSIVFFVVYYIIDTIGYRFATEGFTPIWVGMWLSSFVLLLMGSFLTWKAATDSVMMDSDIYKNFFKKINIFKKKKDA